MLGRVNGFTLLKFLGKGTFGAVYQARREEDGRTYAIKKVDTRRMGSKERAEAVNEIRVLASVAGPHVITFYEAFVEADILYIITEYATHGDLFNYLKGARRRGQLAESTIWSLFIQMCLGVRTLHDKNILHRDLKAANVFMCSSSYLKLGDFGVSKVLKSSEALARTQVGTPYYVSPEVWRNKPYNSKCDMWSLGCLLYELCTYRPPFEAESMEVRRDRVEVSPRCARPALRCRSRPSRPRTGPLLPAPPGPRAEDHARQVRADTRRLLARAAPVRLAPPRRRPGAPRERARGARRDSSPADRERAQSLAPHRPARVRSQSCPTRAATCNLSRHVAGAVLRRGRQAYERAADAPRAARLARRADGRSRADNPGEMRPRYARGAPEVLPRPPSPPRRRHRCRVASTTSRRTYRPRGTIRRLSPPRRRRSSARVAASRRATRGLDAAPSPTRRR